MSTDIEDRVGYNLLDVSMRDMKCVYKINILMYYRSGDVLLYQAYKGL